MSDPEPPNSLSILAHDLRNSFSVINFAAYFLELHELTIEERDLYLDALSRNLLLAESLLRKVSAMSDYPEARTELVSQLQAQLPNVSPKEYSEQMSLLRQSLTALLDGVFSFTE